MRVWNVESGAYSRTGIAGHPGAALHFAALHFVLRLLRSILNMLSAALDIFAESLDGIASRQGQRK